MAFETWHVPVSKPPKNKKGGLIPIYLPSSKHSKITKKRERNASLYVTHMHRYTVCTIGHVMSTKRHTAI